MDSNEFNALRQKFLQAFEGNEAFFPEHLKERHPRVISNVVMLWGSREMGGFLDGLLSNPLMAPNGYSEKAVTEIAALRDFHSRLYPLAAISPGEGGESTREADCLDQRASPVQPAPSESNAAPESVATLASSTGQTPEAAPVPAPVPATKPPVEPSILQKTAVTAAIVSAPQQEAQPAPRPESVEPRPVPAAAPVAVADAMQKVATVSVAVPERETLPVSPPAVEPRPAPQPAAAQKPLPASALAPTKPATLEIVAAPKPMPPPAPMPVQKAALPPVAVPAPQPASKPTPPAVAAPSSAPKPATVPVKSAASAAKPTPETAAATIPASSPMPRPTATPVSKQEPEPLPMESTDRTNPAASVAYVSGKIPAKPEKAAGRAVAERAAIPLDGDAAEQRFLNAFEGNEGALPRKLKEKYPRIYRKIVVLWGMHEIDDYLDDLLIDTRGGRQGFPEEVMTELFELQVLHGRLLPRSSARKKLDTSGITTVEQLQEALDKQSTPQFELKLGEALVHEGMITRKQLKIALADQARHKAGHLGKSLLKLGCVSEEEIERVAAKRLGFVFINLGCFHVEMDAMKLVPREAAIEHKAIPVCILGPRLVVAVENPMAFQGRDFLSFTTGKNIVLVGASLKNIHAQLQIYGEDKSAEEKLQDMQNFIDSASEEYGNAAFSVVNAEDELQLDDAEADISDNSLVKLVNKMIIDAYDQGASDIHLESKFESKALQIRFRRDGQLFSYYTLPSAYRNPVVSRLKVMSHLDISERRRPQDGKIVFSHPRKGKLELRVATLPTVGGMEDMVMRLLSSGAALPLDDIGLSKSNYRKLTEVILKPYGIVLVCGPTGSGKTTTLHSMLREISRPEIKVWTAEDPIEITQDHLCQVQVNPKIGLDFASVIRAFMRADPDVIMIGEMRDKETAKVALEASLTGHMVLSTLHTNSAAESVTRLLEMGMDSFNFADAMLGVISQRLAKKLCPTCKTSHLASASELLEIAEEFAAVASIEKKYHQKDQQQLVESWREQYGDASGNVRLYTHAGCASCGNSGFRGRMGLHELIVTSPEIKRLIRNRADLPDIVIQSIKDGTKTLKQDGIEKVLLGETTLYQIRAACI